jgi:hypothetical protein
VTVAQEQRHPVGVAEAFLAEVGINRPRFEVAQDLLSEGAHLVDETGQTSMSGAASRAEVFQRIGWK